MSPIFPGIVASGISGHLFTPEGSAYEIAQYTVPTGGVSQVTFAIPSGYRHIEIQALTQYSGGPSYGYFKFNGDSGANYSGHDLQTNGVNTPASQGRASESTAYFTMDAGTSPAAPNTIIMSILDYANTTKYKTVRTIYAWDANGTGYIEYNSNNWRSTDAINSITFSTSGSTFAANSTFTLIGYK